MTTSLPGPEGPTSLPPLPPPAPIAMGPTPPKSPGLALLLSFLFPGIGQIYNGQPARALVFFFAFVGSIYGAVEADSPFPFGFMIPFVYIYNIIDAYRGSSLINARFLGGASEPHEEAGDSPAWGATLVVMGLLLLLNNLGWLDLRSVARFWPLALIVAGLAFLRGSLRRRKETRNDSGL